MVLIKKKIFSEIEKTENILKVLRGFEKKYEYKFVDEESKNNCVNRVKKCLNSIVIEGVLREKYCKQAQNYFWIEQRIDEEMSVKVDKQKTDEGKRIMGNDDDEIKRLLCILEKEI
ncbi:gamete antigen 27/25 [Plasmodium brasilianum]|nr:gamete antigen 27/25 [Plasmodium brasilianum]